MNGGTASDSRAAARRPATWATVTTLKEPLDATLEFVAHHAVLGAAEIFLFFDDPADPAIDRVGSHPAVRAIACDNSYWQGRGGRPELLEKRQKENACAAYERASSDWIIHLDADELVECDTAVGRMLEGVAGDVVRLAPFEHIYSSNAGTGGNHSHVFRGALPNNPRGRRAAEAAYGRYAQCLHSGMLSHSEGKFFVRTRLADVLLSIHGPFIGGQRETGETSATARLLHLHGGDYAEWRDRVMYRIEKGAYTARFQRRLERHRGTEATLGGVLSGLYESKGEAGLREFYDAVCTFDRNKRRLRRFGALHRTNLWLEEKRRDLFGAPMAFHNLAIDPDSGQLEGDLEESGLRMRLVPDNNYTECRIARGFPAEVEEMGWIAELVRGRRVLFYDVGANAGVYSLMVARVAKPASRILAFEPNPEMLRRLNRNIALNRFDQVTVRPVALGEQPGTARLAGAASGNLGEAVIGEEGLLVEVVRLTDEMPDPAGFDLSVLKIDVEGHEAAVLAPLLAERRSAGHWPEYILMEHVTPERWGSDLMAALATAGYCEAARTRHNTLLSRQQPA